MSESLRALVLFLGALLALLVFSIGLISPLTPSEGMPSIVEMSIFLGVPLLLSGATLYLTRKTSERVFISVVIIFILAVTTMLFSLLYATSGNVTAAVDARIRAGATAVDIGHLTRFDWDRLFVFGPYSYPKQICDDLGLAPAECSAAGFEDVDEGHYLLVFMKDRGISYRETFSRFTGDFDKSCLAKAIPKTGARFVVTRRSGGSIYLACPSSSNLSDALRRGAASTLCDAPDAIRMRLTSQVRIF